MKNEIPIYLFTGFLEGGKTRFIQETLEDERFSNGDPTLVLVCEEGIEEYDVSKIPQKDIYIKTIASLDELTSEMLEKLEEELCFTRVVLEYNGMWLLDSLYSALPENWVVYQEMLFVDATTFLSYNSNMRSLVVDKLTSCELVVFNRCPENADKLTLHKIVRTTNRRCDIAYEYKDGSVEYDDIEDPLPFDINAPIIQIEDDDYAIWYRDTTEKLNEYNGKTVKFKAVVKKDPSVKNLIVAGRQVMTCCIEDTKLAGFLCETPEASTLSDGEWILLTAKINVKFHKIYKRKGPVLVAQTIEKTSAPDEIIAKFY